MSHNGNRGLDGVTDRHPLLGYGLRKFNDDKEIFEYKNPAHNIYGNVNLSEMQLNPDFGNHLNWVFDLETLGTKLNSIVTEISAVGFDFNTGKAEAEFTVHLDIDAQVGRGRQVSAGTLAFWFSQSEEAREKIKLSSKEFCEANGHPRPLSLHLALCQLSEFIRNYSSTWAYETGKSAEPLVWGNGISFDLGKVINLYETTNLEVPWKYWAECDARTMCHLAPNIKNAFFKDFQGIQHYGLDDCKHEMRYLCAIYNEVKNHQILAEILKDIHQIPVEELKKQLWAHANGNISRAVRGE